jgi:hypothetical protein
MHQYDRQIKLALKQAEVGQQTSHFRCVVFVDTMQPDQWIQQ